MFFVKEKHSTNNFFFHPLAGFFGYRTVSLNFLRKPLSGPSELKDKQTQLQALEKEMKILIPENICSQLDVQARCDLEDTGKIIRVC